MRTLTQATFAAGMIALTLSTTPALAARQTRRHVKNQSSVLAEESAKLKKVKATTTRGNVDATCIKPFIGAREDAIIAAFNTKASAVAAALTARKTAILAAWDLTDRTARGAAVKAAHGAFKTAHKNAMHTYKAAVKSAQETFKSSRTTCNVSDEGASTSESATDQQL